jgi:uncharacterized repeat protein (TIGR01451 family)
VVPDLSVEAVCLPEEVVASHEYCFVVNFSNSTVGSTYAENVIVTDTVPDGFFQDNVFTASTTLGTVTWSGLVVTVNVGTMAPGASGTLEICGNVTASSTAAGTYANTASIDSDNEELNTGNNTGSCSVLVTAPVLSLTKDSSIEEVTAVLTNGAEVSTGEIVEKAGASKTDNGVVTGSRITYILTVTNSGDADAESVVLVDTLPAGTKFISASDGGIHDAVAHTVTWNLGTISKLGGGSNSKTVTVTVETE